MGSMTNHVARLYVAAATVLVLFLAWAVIASHPWPSRSGALAVSDPRLIALQAREQALRAETAAVNRILAQGQARATGATAATVVAASRPAVRVVTLPPLTITRTS